MKVISPFGPKIGKFKLSNQVIKRINAEVDRIVKNKLLYKKLNYSKKLVGQVKQEFQLPKEFIRKFLHKIIEKEVKSFIHKVTNQKIKTVKILNFWVVRQYKNEYNPKVGDIIFFPNYLMHTAYPFHVEGERRSFSLNIQLDQKITNIFHG